MELSEENAKQKLVTYLPSILMKKKNENSFTVEFSLNNKKISNPQTHRERLAGGGGCLKIAYLEFLASSDEGHSR